VTDVVVVGGGIAGLAATDRLSKAGVGVTLLEASERVGGNVCTTCFAGRPLDMGAEMLGVRDPMTVDLVRELTLGDELVTPSCRRAFVWSERGLRPLPSDALSRLPGGLGELLRSDLLTPLGLLRCGWDVIIPSRAPEGDVSIGSIVRSRLGRQVLERIVDPLLGGIHAASCDTLSARALAPQLIGALRSGNGLVRGLRAASAATAGPTFVTLRGGLGSLATALMGRARAAGATVRLGAPAFSVDTPTPGGVIVRQRNGRPLKASACVVATPAGAAAKMLTGSATVAAGLAGIVHSAGAVVALAYPPEALAGLPAGTGFVTAGDERLVRACTWSSSKWEHLAGDPPIVKAFVGNAHRPPPAVGDRDLAAAVHRELDSALTLRHKPVDIRVQRFPAAIPQYLVGHLERLDRIEAALPPQIALAGASYHGAGVGACVRSGQAAAERAIRHLRLPISIDESIRETSRSPA
jgi:oxygen-dependent protoporphyrinogen oxidase